VLLEAGHGDLLDRVGLVVGLGRGHNGRVGDEREMDTRVRHKVGLELVQVDVQGPIKAKRRSNRRDNWNVLADIDWTLRSELAYLEQ
jgi:hypothetical protein